MAKKLWYALPIMAAFLFIFPIEIAQAAPKGGGGDSEITAVVPDYETSYLDIYGSNLSDGIEPFSVVVTLDDIPLSVISATSTWVEVDASLFFADDPTPGDYILVFDSGLQKSRTVEFMLTLGAAGPQGESGTPGNLALAGQGCPGGQFITGFDVSGSIVCGGMAVCGDSQLDPGEQCDDGNFSNEDSCTNECAHAVCGDGYLWTGAEECDDGNLIDGDGCSSLCALEQCATIPQIVDVVPSAAERSAIPPYLTVYGSGFTSESLGYFSGLPVVVTLISDTELELDIPDILELGSYDVTVANGELLCSDTLIDAFLVYDP